MISLPFPRYKSQNQKPDPNKKQPHSLQLFYPNKQTPGSMTQWCPPVLELGSPGKQTERQNPSEKTITGANEFTADPGPQGHPGDY